MAFKEDLKDYLSIPGNTEDLLLCLLNPVMAVTVISDVQFWKRRQEIRHNFEKIRKEYTLEIPHWSLD